MRFARYLQGGREGLCAQVDPGRWHGLLSDDAQFPGFIGHLLASGDDGLERAYAVLAKAPQVDLDSVVQLPPLRHPPKIICLGLNYADHTAESPYEQPSYPTIFARFSSSLVGNGQPIHRPVLSEQLDYEGELVAVIGRGGKHISKASALDHVAGWSIFNDASVRDFQLNTPQWTVGKNFDNTGAFGPCFVTADEVPPGARGLRVQTRLNGQTVQNGNTADLIFDVATIIETISAAITLEPGDVIVTGTPAGVGAGRTPPLWMKAGDEVEVEVEGIGILRNPVADEPALNGARVEKVAVSA